MYIYVCMYIRTVHTYIGTYVYLHTYAYVHVVMYIRFFAFVACSNTQAAEPPAEGKKKKKEKEAVTGPSSAKKVCVCGIMDC